MIDEKLMRRISDALSSDAGLDGDEGLRAILSENAAARAYADELGKLDAVFRGWPAPRLDTDVARAQEERILGGLDGAGKLFGDYTQAPKFDDAYANAPPEGGFSVDDLASLSVAKAASVSGKAGPSSGAEPKARASLPPLPAPTGERAAVPDVAPVQLTSGFTIPSAPVPVDAPADDAPRRRAAPASARRYSLAIAAVTLLAGGVVALVSMRGGEPAGLRAAPAAVSDGAAPTSKFALSGGSAGIEAEEAAAPADGAGAPTPSDRGAAADAPANEALAVADVGDEKSDDAELNAPARRKLARAARASPAAAKAKASLPKAAPAGGALADGPSKEQVLAAMKAVEPRVMACKTGRHGTLLLKITVSGATGNVQSAIATGSFAGSPEGSCAARAVRSAKFPKFKKPSLTISYPFRF